MTDKERLAGALGMCRKAGKLAMGFDASAESAVRGKSFLILLASDLSPRTVRRMKETCERLVPCELIPLTQSELLDVAGKPTGVFSVLDENFARLCKKHIGYIENKEENIE